VRADRPSLTASLVAALRALYTALPEPYRLTSDPFAAELVPAILALPARGAALFPGAAPFVHRAVGALSLGLSYHVALRTRAIDDALREAVAGGATQLVVLGAGLDSRAERLPELAGARVFEVDHPSTQRYKAERLARMGARPRARAVARVAIDFERDRLDEALVAAGLDPAARSFWIWEGVTVYLTPDAIAATLAAVGALSAPGSRLAVTYTRPGRRRAPAWLDPLSRVLGSAVGEPLRGMMETDAMFAALAQAGLERVSDEGAAEWAARSWPGDTPADEWERLAVAERRPGATSPG
jgi:methyltransferase (TIGR00027 family)